MKPIDSNRILDHEAILTRISEIEASTATSHPASTIESTTESATALPPSTAKPTFMNLPLEIHLELFKHFDRVQSTLFGLTCSTFYKFHWERHGKVGLYEIDDSKPYQTLWIKLKGFMHPMYKWDGHKGPGHFHYVRTKIETPRKVRRKLLGGSWTSRKTS